MISDQEQVFRLDIEMLKRMLLTMGVRTLDDLRALPLDAMTFMVRILVGQACFLRMVEHRDGMRVDDVSFTTNLEGQTTAILRVKSARTRCACTASGCARCRSTTT